MTRLVLSGLSPALPVAVGAATGHTAVIAFVAALLGGLGTIEAKAAGQAVVFTIIGAHLGSGSVSANRLTGYVLLGMLTGAALTLAPSPPAGRCHPCGGAVRPAHKLARRPACGA